MENLFENFGLFNTNLSLTPKYRAEAAVIINNELTLFKKPIILTGDINVSGYKEFSDLFDDL